MIDLNDAPTQSEFVPQAKTGGQIFTFPVNIRSRCSAPSTVEALRNVLPEIRDDVQGLKPKGNSGELAGPCPKCGGDDRFYVRPDRSWACRQCHPKGGGDKIDFHKWIYDIDFKELAERYSLYDKSEPPKKEKLPEAAVIPANLKKEYPYHDKNGSELFRVQRYEAAECRKTFRQGYLSNQEWVPSVKGLPNVPFHLPELLASTCPVLLLEGEKDVETAEACGFTATTNSGGAGNWTDEHSRFLANRDVVIISDCDKAGDDRTSKALDSLRRIGARSVKVVRLPNPDRIEKYDLTDFLTSFQDSETAAERLSIMIDGAADVELSTAEPMEDVQDNRKIGFRFMHVSELGLSAPEYLIDGLLETDSMAVFFGDTGAMKSAFLFGAAFSVASGTLFHGRKVKQGPVVLIIGEGQQGFTRRKAAWEIRHQVNLGDCPLYISSAPADMTDPTFMKEMATLLDQIAEQQGSPALIVIDTLAANFGAADENATKDMTCFVQSMNSLRARYRATVATAHHVGQGDKTRGRGNRALKAGVDAEYFLNRVGEIVEVHNHKMKEGAPPPSMAFKPVVVELPFADQEGRPVTSFVLDEVPYDEPEAPTGKTGRGKWQQAALDILADLYSRHEGNLEAGGHTPDGARVTVSDWREAVQREGLKNRSTFVRLQETLTKQKKIRVDHSYVELLG